MKNLKIIPLIIFMLPLSGCGNQTSNEKVMSLYLDSSRLYFESLKKDESCLLKTYHHKKFGDIPYVRLDEYCDTFPLTSINGMRSYEIVDGKFIVSNNGFGTFSFDAKKDVVTTSKEVLYFFKDSGQINNVIPLDIYYPAKTENIIKGSTLTSYLDFGKDRTYNCKKYNFDIVYEDDVYYAPFSLLTSLFFEHRNETFIFNGKDYFDVDGLTGENQTIQYCYSSKGNFLLDFSGGKLGASLYENKTPENGEEYHFENIVAASGQKTVFSLANGAGFIRSYSSDGKLIEEDVFKKVKYEKQGNILVLKYFSVFDENDDEKDAVSDIYTLYIHLDETNFLKKTRSKEVAEFTYQELRFAMYELYGKTINTEVRDFDKFIKDKDYKDDLLSLDVDKYDTAMTKFLLKGINDAHTSIVTTSIYGLPTMANANHYSTLYPSTRADSITSLAVNLREKRKNAGISEGLNIVNKTAVISFNKFNFTRDKKGVAVIKAYQEYQGTDPSSYVEDNTMELFASAFNEIEKHKEVKNVVFDISSNTGGKTATMAYLVSYLTDDPSIVINKQLNESHINYHYLVDLNQDGIYGSSQDTFKGKYNFYILTSNASFSCGNHFPQICKDGGFAKIIGQKTAGGSCSISQISNSSGFLYCSSSENIAVMKNGDGYINNDSGVTPDISLDESYWFDHVKLDNYLNGIE